MLSAPFSASLNATPQWTTPYDVGAWCCDGYIKDLTSYPYPTPQTFTTTVSPDQRALIESRIDTFGEHPSGLGKFTRTMFARDLRRTLRQIGNVETKME
jgi:hypothetical protein